MIREYEMELDNDRANWSWYLIMIAQTRLGTRSSYFRLNLHGTSTQKKGGPEISRHLLAQIPYLSGLVLLSFFSHLKISTRAFFKTW